MPDDKPAVRQVIRTYIVPDFRSLTAASQLQARQSLAYFLTTDDAPFGKRLADLQDSPMAVGDDPVKFFRWLWSELFPNEDYHVETKGWQVHNSREHARLFWKVGEDH